MPSAGGQLLLLLWKNFKLQGRKKFVTLFEFVVPLFFAILLLMFRTQAKRTNIDHISTWDSFSLLDNQGMGEKIYFTPHNTFTNAIMQGVANEMDRALNFTGFDTEGQIIKEWTYNDNKDLWAAVVFTSDTTGSLPQNVRYKLRLGVSKNGRWKTDLTYNFHARSGYRNNMSTGGFGPDYYGQGFLRLQYAVNKAYMMYVNPNTAMGNQNATMGKPLVMELKKMPFPPFQQDTLIVTLKTMLPLFLVFSFILSTLQMAKNLGYEKEKKLKEAMKMMGLSTSIYWLSWFMKNLTYLVIVLLIYVLIFNIDMGEDYGKLFNYTDLSVLFVYLLLYILSTIAFAFMVSTFCSTANSAALVAGTLHFLTFFPYIMFKYENMSRTEKLFACLLHNVGLGFGIKALLMYEEKAVGAKWNNFNVPAIIDDNFSVLDAMVMLLVDTVLYMVIAWYVDQVNPGDAGVAQPLWFPFKHSYWCGSKVEVSSYQQASNGVMHMEHFECDPPGATVGVSIRHLRKVFDDTSLLGRCSKDGNEYMSEVAVSDTSLNMFESQITSLLGHNGAGKTTTISMLTGFLKPTSGTAVINGKDISTDIDEVRKSMGLCPQHNILFDLLDVEEHLRFFAKLKGCESGLVDKEVKDMIEVLGLQEKRHTQSQFLSGGQKRKLSVGIALIAGSKVVILDEPTSGMDPAARRQTWEILQRYREGRTIILTTHFMDEADILGDRIAIMADGVVKCCGTSMFLKKLYGAGYHLVAVKNKTCNVDRLTQLVQSHIPSATIESQISAEISYLLPFNESKKFEALFREVEDKMSELGIDSFGTSATTMEEVFLKVGEVAEEELGGDKSKNPGNSVAYGSQEDGTQAVVVMNNLPKQNFISYNEGIKRNAGTTLSMQQFYSMFVKKFIQARRNIAVAVAQMLIPVFFTTLALCLLLIFGSNTGDEPALALDMAPFADYTLAYSDGMTSTSDKIALMTAYKDQFSGNTHQVDRTKYATFDSYFQKVQGDIGIHTFNSRFIVAGDFQSNATRQMLKWGNYGERIEWNFTYDPLVAHFNGEPLHSIAISLQYAMNGVLQKEMTDAYSIAATNHPLPVRIADMKESSVAMNSANAFFTAIFILFGMAFMATSFIIFPIQERSVGAKHLQAVSGVGPFAFWASTFIWDMINYTIPVLIILMVFLVFGYDVYVDENRLGLVFLIFMLYGFSVLPFVYLLNFLFIVPATGMVAVSMINLLSGVVSLVATTTLSKPEINMEDTAKSLETLLIIFLPNYNLGLSLNDMYINYANRKNCQHYPAILCQRVNASNPCCFPDHCGNTCYTYYSNFLSWNKPGLGRECIFMLVQGLVYFSIVLLIDYGIIRRIKGYIMQTKPMHVSSQVDMSQDDDVAEEEKRIQETPLETLHDTDSLILKNVCKMYGNFQAVKNISVGIPKNECFGLMGQNGAGKTTTFKMMTGDEPITAGNAFLNRFSVKKDLNMVQKNLGYCPQFDALIDQMTGRETLYMYARLRGIQESQIKDAVDKIIDVMMLHKHADKQTEFYSGGNKRKLSTAVALIGDPPFIFLDEPTTGMDPAARRQLWNVLSDVRASGKTLILTSHSMEECDALCTRIVIMVKGKFMCYGSPQHLKNKFGNGYTLFCHMGLKDGEVVDSSSLVAHLNNIFPHIKVFDDEQGYVHFHIPETDAKLGQIFGTMEKIKEAFNVDDYTVHQTTLEQVFLTFNKKPDNTRRPSRRPSHV